MNLNEFRVYNRFTDNLEQRNIECQQLKLKFIIMIVALSKFTHQVGCLLLKDKNILLRTGLFRSAVSNAFSQQKSYSSQLDTYQAFLTKHQLSIKKPHPKLQSEEERIVAKYIAEKRFSSLINFLFNNSDKSLCHQQTASKIDQALVANWQSLSSTDKLVATYSLSCLREVQVFELFKKSVIQRIDKFGLQNIAQQELIVYLIGQLINRKSIDFIDDLFPKRRLSLNHTSASPNLNHQELKILYDLLVSRGYNGNFNFQYSQLQQYLNLLIDPTLNKMEPNIAERNRSRLQVQVQSLLIAMQLPIRRQCKVNGYKVDFLIQLNSNKSNISPQFMPNDHKEFILQVNGSYHYTLNGLIKGKQVIRNLIVGQYAPLRIIHFQDYLSSKGHRNKIAHIQNLLTEESDVNWEMRKSGTNSDWQVLVDEDTMKQFL